jgi:hypothetical protein
MKFYKNDNVNPEDVLEKIQRSFQITLDDEGLRNVNSVGNLCDVIAKKMIVNHSDNCTTQHAFYKLREAIAHITAIDKCAIKPQTRLSAIFPRENRLDIIEDIENEFDLKINLLQPRQLVVGIFVAMLLVSLTICFFNWEIGISGTIISGICLKLAGKFGKEIHLKTVGDLANKIARESYQKSKRNACAVNKREIEQKVRELFSNDLGLEPVVLRRESKFN